MVKTTCEHSGIEFDSKEDCIETLIGLNQRLNFLLGYAMGFICKDSLESEDEEKRIWLLTAIENLLYLNKPLPPLPK